MKKVVVVFAVIFAVVVSSCNCNDDKKAGKDGVTTEAVAKKDCDKKSCKGDKPCCADKSDAEKAACKAECKKSCSKEKKECAADCKKACCAEKMECAADCKKACCAEKSKETKTACAADCKKECCADKATM